MKKCPYCAEEIQDEAKKCKHCGEWLEGNLKADITNTAKSILSKSSSFIKQQINTYQENRYKDLHIPSDINPISFGDATFRTDSFDFGTTNYLYSEIVGIYYYSSVSYTNGIKTETKNDFIIYLSHKDHFPIELRFDIRKINLSKSSFFGIGNNSKTRDKMDYIQNYLKKITFENRLTFYLDFISNNDFFNYPRGYKIFNNGDIQRKDKVLGNINEASKNQLIDYGDVFFQSLKVQFSSPSTFIIWPSKDSSRSVFAKKIEIDVLYDKDVFDFLVNKIISDGHVIDK